MSNLETKNSKNNMVKTALMSVLLFVLYFVFAYVAMWPGYLSPLYWLLFPVAASFLTTGTVTAFMQRHSWIGSTLLFPLILFILSKLMGELGFACAWIPFAAAMLAAEIVRNLLGRENTKSIRFSAPILALTWVFWNNGFYFGGASYIEAAAADMGIEYAERASQLATPVMYVIVLAGSVAAAYLCEHLTERIWGKKQ